MNRLVKSFIFVSCLYTNSYSQLDFSYSGYVVEMPVFQSYSSRVSEYLGVAKSQFLNLTRARLRSTLGLWKNARLEAEYEMDALYFNPSNNLELNLSGKTNRQLFDLRWNPVHEEHFSLTHFIDRLYFWQGFKSGSVVLGRQRISWGTGRIWNPTDLFNPINPASYYKIEKEGADAISGKYSFGSFTDLNIVFNPREKIKNSNYGFRFRTNYAEYDFSVIGGYFDGRITGGLDFAGNLFNAGVRGEGIVSVNKDSTKDRYLKFILGIDNQFTSEIYGLLEYHYNGEGKTDKSAYDFERLAKGEIQNLNRNYLCVSFIYQFNPLVNIMFTDITNLSDASGFVNLLASYSAKENLTLSIGSQLTYGCEKTEYWYYPFSFYLQGEFYF